MFSGFKLLLESKGILFELIKNDFRQKYLGSYMGIIWAFFQPVISVLIFWFVFQVGFKSPPVDDHAFILWLLAGILPWFCFADSLSSSTSSILDNSYLVKKIVFNVSYLPLIRIASAFIIHLFFIGFMMLIYIVYGYEVKPIWLQLTYYMISMAVLIYGLVLITSSLIIFVRDVGHFVSMILQFGFWLTPIFWAVQSVPLKYHWLLNLNPFVYIINGYRDTMLYDRYFWEDPLSALYFWIFTIFVLCLGRFTFKKLRPHFADVI